jgi:adenylate cyclase
MTDSSSDATSGFILMADCGAPLEHLADTLIFLGFELHRVAGFETVLAQAETSLPDLIVVQTGQFTNADLRLCRLLKRRPSTRSIPIVVIGQEDDPKRRLVAFEAGVADYILQSLWQEEIVARIKAQVDNYRLQRRLRIQAQRAMSVGSPTSLLADLQRALRRQAQLLQAQNQQLQQEMEERAKAQEALRLEQQKSEKLLLNILPKAIVEQLKQLQGSLAERFDDVTILFADIVNFTPLAAHISPLDLVNWLNQVFSEFDRLAERYGLEKIKTIGDAYMVVGGLPLPTTDHVEAVMEMALAMQAAAHRIARNDGQDFQLRIGINTGTVVAGVIGIKNLATTSGAMPSTLPAAWKPRAPPGRFR